MRRVTLLHHRIFTLVGDGGSPGVTRNARVTTLARRLLPRPPLDERAGPPNMKRAIVLAASMLCFSAAFLLLPASTFADDRPREGQPSARRARPAAHPP